MLIEDANIISVLGIDMYAYGLHAALGALLCLLFLALTEKKAALPRGGAALTGVCMLLCGFVFSRLLFVLFDGSMRSSLTLEGILYIQGGGYSMYGALLGACMGAWLAGKALHADVKRLMDYVVTALLLFIAAVRMGEMGTDVGISRPLVGDVAGFGPFVTAGEYDSYVSTYLIEAILALCLFSVCALYVKKCRKAGHTALLGMLLFGASQTVMESLRFDQHMKFSFVGVQQVLSMLLLIAVMMVFGVMARKKGQGKKLFTASIVYLVFLMGAVIGLEFLIDRSGLSRMMLYMVYVLLLAVPCVMGIRLKKLAERE